MSGMMAMLAIFQTWNAKVVILTVSASDESVFWED